MEALDKHFELTELEDNRSDTEDDISVLLDNEKKLKAESARLLHLEEVLYGVSKEARLRSPLYVVPASVITLGVVALNPLTTLGFGLAILSGLALTGSSHIINSEYPKITPDGSRNIFKVLKELKKSRREVKTEYLTNEDKLSKVQREIEDKYHELEDIEKKRQKILADSGVEDLSKEPLFCEVLSQYKQDREKTLGIKMQPNKNNGNK